MELKKKILECCRETLDSKISALNMEIAKVQESAISDTKSSMGDKYETGREVMMQEKNRLGGQLEIYLKQATSLSRISIDQVNNEVKTGSLVKTDKGLFFMSVPIGQLNIEGTSVFAISMGSPIGKEMYGKSVGAAFSFNSHSHTIEEIR